MRKNIYRSIDRGSADYGWLRAKYSFSFANYFNPEKTNFGALRVLNDDIMHGGMGFGMHPHNNMEIISIPLRGAMKHKDSMSNEWIPLKAGEVQVMSAGKGIMHSETNNSPTEEVNLFQIWIMPDTLEVNPRYDQKSFDKASRMNNLQILVSSMEEDFSGTLKIHQDALISRIDLDKNNHFEYKLKSLKRGVYIMVISGNINIENEALELRDAIGISETESVTIQAKSETELLFIEVPMKI